MIIKNNIPVYSISWLNYCEGGVISHFYEPESKEELITICKKLYSEGKPFDLIGHTSNTYFLPSYNVDYMVSTRRVKNIVVDKDYIDVDCGVSVRSLSRQMVEEGVKGFEGLVDLPGTVGAAVYGNASCYNCSVNQLLLSVDILTPKGETVVLNVDELKLSHRSSILKRKELKGVILSVKLRIIKGNPIELKQISEYYHNQRKLFQPSSKNNLGSIYKDSIQWSSFSYIPRLIVYFYGLLLKMLGNNQTIVKDRKKKMIFFLLGEKQLSQYVYDWNRYIWEDEESHNFFWKFHKLHKLMFKKSEFEIEIRQ